MTYQFRTIIFDDLSKLLEHRNLNSTRKWLENESTLTSFEQKVWFESGGANNFKIVSNQDNDDIGIVRIKIIDAETIQVGLDIFEEYRGKGFSKLVFKKLIEELQNQAKIFDLWVFLANEPALKTYLNLGFKFNTNVPVKFYMRQWSGNEIYPYVNMRHVK
jgi:RimJ/RimL family protein N-acetyltransferase